MTVSFCGNSRLFEKDRIRKWLFYSLECLIQEGADSFYLGGYGEFDSLAASVVHKLKNNYPDIKSILVIPYLDKRTQDTRYDQTTYPPLENVPRKHCIPQRNRWMIDNADVIVACVSYSGGGSGKTLEYAQKQNKRIIRYDFPLSR